MIIDKIGKKIVEKNELLQKISQNNRVKKEAKKKKIAFLLKDKKFIISLLISYYNDYTIYNLNRQGIYKKS